MKCLLFVGFISLFFTIPKGIPHHFQAIKRFDAVADDTSKRHGGIVEAASSLKIGFSSTLDHMYIGDSIYLIDSAVEPTDSDMVVFTTKAPTDKFPNVDTLTYRFDIDADRARPGQFHVMVRGSHWINFEGERVYNTSILYYFECLPLK